MEKLNDQDKQVLLQLLDLANKAGGLNVAQSCLYFVQKFELAPKKEEESKEK